MEGIHDGETDERESDGHHLPLDSHYFMSIERCDVYDDDAYRLKSVGRLSHFGSG
jgi:hypothetical protein